MKAGLKATLLIPVYNGGRYVEKAVISACSQKFNDYEVIVVDDGSTDNTPAVLSRLSEEYSFKLISQTNQGVCHAMNAGLAVARGQYFCWGGHDDVFLPDRIRLHVEFLDQNPDYAACYSNVEYIDGEDRHLGYGKRRHLRSGRILKDLFWRNFIPAPASMVRTSLLREIGGFDADYIVEDYPLWLTLAEKYPIGFFDAVVTQYRLHGSNMSGDPEKFFFGIQEIVENWASYPECRKALRYWYRRWFCDATKYGSTELVERFLQKLRLVDFIRPRILRSYSRYRLRRRGLGESEASVKE